MKKVKSVANKVTNPIKNVISGKKQEADPISQDVMATQADALGLQKFGIGKLRPLIDDVTRENPTQLANAEANQESKIVRSGIEDSRRRIDEILARRGLGNTSLGLGQKLGAETEGREKLMQIKASLPDRIRAIRERQIQAIGGGIAAGTGVVGSQSVPIRFQAGRSGGLLDMFGPAFAQGLGKAVGGG